MNIRMSRSVQFVTLLSRMSLENLRAQYLICGENMQEEESREGRIIYERMMRCIEAVTEFRFHGASVFPDGYEPPDAEDKQPCDPLYGQRMDSADMGEN